MAKEKTDVDFTYDTTGFVNGLKNIASGIADVTKNTVNMAKNVSKGVINAVAKLGLLKLAFNGIRSAIQRMPEIGKGFNIAKDIILKNFLFPVRKAILPVLQKFLDWVRDNRTMFVKWGQTLVTIFTVVSKAIGNVIDLGKRLIHSFGDFFNRTFGTNIKSFQDLLNILSFKFAVVVEFLKRLLAPIVNTIKPLIETLVENIGKIWEPVSNIAKHLVDIATSLLTANENGNSLVTIFQDIMGFVGDAAKWSAEMVESFIKGFKPYISPVVDQIAKIAKSFKEIWSSIFGSSDKLQGWKSLFEFIGEVIGVTLVAAFEHIADMMKTIEASVKFINDIIKLLTGQKMSKEFEKNTFNMLQGIMDLLMPGQKFLREELEKERGKGVHDAIIKPDGQVIATDPADYLIATKTPGDLVRGGNVFNIDFTGMNLVIQNASQEQAMRFGENIVEIIRDQVDRELVRSGAM